MDIVPEPCAATQPDLSTNKPSPAVLMTERERSNICVILRRREKLQKTAAAKHAAELMADAERQLSARFSYDDDDIWRKAQAAADAVVGEGQRAVAARCEELGIPKEFAPGLSLCWYSRGENAVKARRDELRRLAQARVDAMLREAILQIETRSVEYQEQVMAGGFTTAAAREFLDALPAPESLMPPIDVRQLLLTNERKSTRGSPV
jgi:hypothetical protein